MPAPEDGGANVNSLSADIRSISVNNREESQPNASIDTSAWRATNFLDLPGELRNEIYYSYPHPLRYTNEQRLVLKQKRRSNGQVVIKEPTPALCYAAPHIWQEALSVYYSENCFRVNITTARQRETFRTWAQHRVHLLKGLKSLRLTWRPHLDGDITRFARRCRVDVGLDADGGLHVSVDHLPSRICVHRIEEWIPVAQAEVEEAANTAMNLVLQFALKLCDYLDLHADSCEEAEER